MRILILWADDRSANLGVRALAEGARRMALAAFEDAEIAMQDFAPNEQGFAFGRQTLLADVGRRAGPAKQFLQSFDLILDTGAGDSFTDGYGLKRLLIMLYVQRVAIKAGVPVVQLPQTIGPFGSRLGKRMAASNLRHMEKVMTRDSVSYEVAHALGGDVVPATDMVFALPIPQVPKTRDVIFNPSGLLWADSNPHVDGKKYRQDSHGLILALLNAGRDVKFLTHVLDNDSSDNDAIAARELRDMVDPEIEILEPEDLDEARRLLASAHIVIGARMHACLNAISVGTPAVAWAYSRKFAPLLGDLGWNSVVDLRSDNDVVSATAKMVEELAGTGGEIVLAQIRSSVDEMFKLAAFEIEHIYERFVNE